MQIKILGTRGEVPESAPKHSKHSGVLVDDRLLLDLGEQEFLKNNPRWILLTHLHPDHAFWERNMEEVNIDVPVYAPERSKNVEVELFKPNATKKLGGYKITSIPTHHSKLVKSQGYLVEKSGKKFLYTGDLLWIDKKYHKLLKDLDLIVTDGSFIRQGGMIKRDKKTGAIYGHAGIPNLIKLFSPFAKKIIFVHFGSWFFKDIKEAKKKLQELGAEYGVKVDAGFDGMNIAM